MKWWNLELKDRTPAWAEKESLIPAAQIVRDLMRSYIARQEMPNAETIAAIEAAEHGEVTTHASTADLYRTLGI